MALIKMFLTVSNCLNWSYEYPPKNTDNSFLVKLWFESCLTCKQQEQSMKLPQDWIVYLRCKMAILVICFYMWLLTKC